MPVLCSKNWDFEVGFRFHIHKWNPLVLICILRFLEHLYMAILEALVPYTSMFNKLPLLPAILILEHSVDVYLPK